MFIMRCLKIKDHRFLGLPAAKPRVWIDLSSSESKRAGLAMHSPGRMALRWAVKVLGWFSWLPIEKIIRGPIKSFEEVDGHEVIERIVEGESVNRMVQFLTLYMGNESAKSKLTVMIRVCQRGVSKRDVIVKLGRTPEASEAIKNEAVMLKRLEDTELLAYVPVVLGDVGHDGIWTWSVQSVLPKGESPVKLRNEHYEFLEELKRIGISHGDFVPWNCSIVGGKLYVWDWEDAGPWVEGKDENWFKSQVKKLLRVDA